MKKFTSRIVIRAIQKYRIKQMSGIPRKITRKQIEMLAIFLGISECDKFTIKQAYKDFANIPRRLPMTQRIAGNDK